MTSGGQAGAPRRGHVYVWSRSSDKAAADDSDVRVKFVADCVPPAKGEGGAGGGGGGGAVQLPKGVRISCPYAARAGLPGKRDGEPGFFSTDDGDVKV
jgi:hypothetical protein